MFVDNATECLGSVFVATNIYDIARLSGVSVSTVSKAMNNYKGINENTKRRILAIASENDFYPNSIAKGLVTGQSHVIGFFLNDAINSGFRHPFFQRVIQGSKNALGEAGYDILFFTNAKFTVDRAYNDYLNRAQHRLVDGVILMGMDRGDVGAHEVAVSGLPSMAIDMELTGARSGYVQSNNVEAARQVVNYLTSLGHKKIAIIGDCFKSKPGEDRERGFAMAVRTHRLPSEPAWREMGDFTRESGFAAMNRMLKGPDLPTAVFAVGDLMALGAMDAIRERGLSVPQDISVVGFDDIESIGSNHPPLTTVRQNMEYIGERAGEALVQLIENPHFHPPVLTVDTELIIRETCQTRT